MYEPNDDKNQEPEPEQSDDGSPPGSPDDGSPPGSPPGDDDVVVSPVVVLDAVSGLLSKALAVDPGGLGESELCDSLVGIETIRKQLDALSTVLLVETDGRDTTNETTGHRTGPWLAGKANLPVADTRARVRVANKLARKLPAVLEALLEGRIGWDHATLLVRLANPRIIDELADMIPHILDLATRMTYEAWKREVTNITEQLDVDGGHRPGDDITDNTLRLSPMHDNTIVITGQLCGELGRTLKDAVDAQADSLFKQMQRDAKETDGELKIPGRATLNALALVELINQAVAADSTASSTSKAAVSLIINANDPTTVTDRDGILIGDTDRYTCLCDPVFTPIIVDTKGIVTDLGRTQRLASDAQRKAMAHRDGGCVFPGCDRPPQWTDAHHTWHWNKGGPTDLPLLASLCRHHHMITHRKNWTMTVTPDQWFTWTTPNGQTIHSQRHGQQQNTETGTGTGDENTDTGTDTTGTGDD